MAVEDLRNAPAVPYHELSKLLKIADDSLRWGAQKAERQGVFLSALQDFIQTKPVLEPVDRSFLLDCFKQHFNIEFEEAMRRREELAKQGI